MMDTSSLTTIAVASFAEAWIEISRSTGLGSEQKSPPSRRRGLKCDKITAIMTAIKVASFAEAWIEILKTQI